MSGPYFEVRISTGDLPDGWVLTRLKTRTTYVAEARSDYGKVIRCTGISPEAALTELQRAIELAEQEGG